MIILGISAFYHDSAACIIENGNIIASAQEERFSRKKHDANFPEMAINYVLSEREITVKEINYVVFYDKPLLKFERLLETYISVSPKGFPSFRKAMPVWIKQKLFLKNFILNWFKEKNENFSEVQIKFSEHHLSHAASAFYPSPFKNAVILTMDGVGEWATSSIAIGSSNGIEIIKELHFPHSLGLLYSAFTQYCGFRVNSGEYKLMGLSPYGEPKYKEIILKNLIDLKNDGSFQLNMDYFNYMTGLSMVNDKFENLFGKQARQPDDEMHQFYMDIAASVQNVTELVVLKIITFLSSINKSKNLCLAGGVALNCVANSKILQAKEFENVWVQPAAGDAGGALGAALAFYYENNGLGMDYNPMDLSCDKMKGSYLGPEFTEPEILATLEAQNVKYTRLNQDRKTEYAAELITKNKLIGWFQGRMEFGPRALGNRSILGNPLSDTAQGDLNRKIKFRESFRPFAPSVLYEEVDKWFQEGSESPYMTFVMDVHSSKRKKILEDISKLKGLELLTVVRSEIPAVTHVNYSARVQTVHKDTNPLFHQLISNFFRISNCPMLINTSFNVRGQPIVCTPKDALECFFGTELDYLFIGNFCISKHDNYSLQKEHYNEEFPPD
tara:strand:- start:7114 stop:8955 length:1842 start_codon:yes stop_codon:yes gene_type:complete